MALDTANPGDDETPVSQAGSDSGKRAVVADTDRLYQLDEHSRVLIHQGHTIPVRLLCLPYLPAVLLDGVYVPAPKPRTKGKAS